MVEPSPVEVGVPAVLVYPSCLSWERYSHTYAGHSEDERSGCVVRNIRGTAVNNNERCRHELVASNAGCTDVVSIHFHPDVQKVGKDNVLERELSPVEADHDGETHIVLGDEVVAGVVLEVEGPRELHQRGPEKVILDTMQVHLDARASP